MQLEFKCINIYPLGEEVNANKNNAKGTGE